MKKTYIFLALACLPAIWFLLVPGGYEPHDLHHLADIYQMAQAFSSGQIPPRLGPDFLYGFGYPLFNYYYVLPFYLGALFFGLFGSLMAAFKLVFLLSALASVFGMYLLLNKFFGKAASAAGAIVYMYTPFRAVEIFVRGAIGEAVAIALFPWFLYSLVRLIKQTDTKNIAVSSIVLALFLLSHNYFFLLVAPFTVLFVGVMLYFEAERLKKIRGLFITGILGVGLSAYWWLPAFSEYNLVSAVTPFVIEDHFPFLKQLIFPSWGYGSSVWGPYDLISFQIGIVNLVVAAATLPVLVFAGKRLDRNYVLTALAFLFFGVSVFMMNIRSLFIWNLIPFTNFIQFPWRLLALTTFFTAFLAGALVDRIKFKRLAAFLLVVMCVLLTFGYFRPSKVVFTDNDYYVERLFANPEFSEDYLLLPPASRQKPDFVPKQRFGVENGQVISENKLSSVHWEAEIDADRSTIAKAYVLNFPGWFVEVDGKEVVTTSESPYGNVTFALSDGLHKVELYWAETRLRLIADALSLLSLLVIVSLCFRSLGKRATI